MFILILICYYYNVFFLVLRDVQMTFTFMQMF